MKKTAAKPKRSPKPKAKARDEIVVRVLRTLQGDSINVFTFFMQGADVIQIADISRVERDKDDSLKGFQRRAIRTHVLGIVNYLNQGKVLFPNAIILAMSPDVRFVKSRGPSPEGSGRGVEAGLLIIPIRPEGERVAWIVDGQQRSLALAESNTPTLPVPVVGFVSDDIAIQREQFILVNKARPLPTRLINELLPETGGVILPRDLASRKIPSTLCNLLNRDPKSPFHKLIKRTSAPDSETAIITDTAIVTMIRNSISNPLGALAPFKSAGDDAADLQAMYKTLTTYWNAVRDVFKSAWGLPPQESRLMHSAGIQAMGVLMDRIYARHAGKSNEYQTIRQDLEKMRRACHWTEGEWESLGLAWNEIENTHRGIRSLTDALVRIHTHRAGR
jgi:DGQHR domain-containing protein